MVDSGILKCPEEEKSSSGGIMEQNMGTVDKVIRTIVAILIIVAYLMGMLPRIAGLLLIISGSLLSSVVSGYCPLYTKIGVNTNR